MEGLPTCPWAATAPRGASSPSTSSSRVKTWSTMARSETWREGRGQTASESGGRPQPRPGARVGKAWWPNPRRTAKGPCTAAWSTHPPTLPCLRDRWMRAPSSTAAPSCGRQSHRSGPCGQPLFSGRPWKGTLRAALRRSRAGDGCGQRLRSRSISSFWKNGNDSSDMEKRRSDL